MTWLLPAMLITGLTLAVVIALAVAAGMLVRDSRAPRIMTEDDFDEWDAR